MSEADVGSIQSLDELRRAVDRLGDRLLQQGHQVRAVINKSQHHFSQDYPVYWKRQLRLAEQRHSEALDRLSRKQSVVGAGQAVPAADEKKEVARWKARKGLCRQRLERTRTVAVEMEQNCEKMKGPIADLMELAEVTLPNASARLATLVARLQAYDGS
ncbi:hypothetical protein [Allorhodopirellula solitaria]|uniref:Uncharacterized protein n=1 Tax=Allorhodopirellula solitaria TaxID=2527987 RepID=A0A5C5YHL3_9BACT|nr:hypothetical protein [Allorhodopirellula solitaria]TWT74285.1 hypothetical protein CA85_11720 [Allorhodopirellula solitaria]